MSKVNIFNNLIITLFIILFCYILFCWIAKSCFGSKIIEGIETKDTKKDTDSSNKTEPKKVTKTTIQEKDEKKPSEEDMDNQTNQQSDNLKKFNQSRKDDRPTPPAGKLTQARFS